MEEDDPGSYRVLSVALSLSSAHPSVQQGTSELLPLDFCSLDAFWNDRRAALRSEPATAFPHRGAMIALRTSPKSQQLPCHAPSFSRTSALRVPFSAGCWQPTLSLLLCHPLGLLWSIPKVFPLRHLATSAEAVLFPHSHSHPDLNKKNQIN